MGGNYLKKMVKSIKNNVSIEIPAHYIPSFKPAKIFVDEVKDGVTTGLDQ